MKISDRAELFEDYYASITKYSDGVVVLRVLPKDGRDGAAIPLTQAVIDKINNPAYINTTSGFNPISS